MNRPLFVDADADAESEETAVWYGDRRVGLDLEFLAAVDRVLAEVAETPDRFSIWVAPWRRAAVRRFPYSVFFEVEPERVVVVGVAHACRRPGCWVERRGPAGGE